MQQQHAPDPVDVDVVDPRLDGVGDQQLSSGVLFIARVEAFQNQDLAAILRDPVAGVPVARNASGEPVGHDRAADRARQVEFVEAAVA